MSEGFLRLTRKWPEGAAVAALRDIDAVSHKKHRSACRRINQCFPKTSSVIGSDYKKPVFIIPNYEKSCENHSLVIPMTIFFSQILSWSRFWSLTPLIIMSHSLYVCIEVTHRSQIPSAFFERAVTAFTQK